MHLTAGQAVEHAAAAGVGRLVLTHLVPWNDRARTLAEASEVPFEGEISLCTHGAGLRPGLTVRARLGRHDCVAGPLTPGTPGCLVFLLGSSPMRVLVTGGAGFIGSHVTDSLLARGDEVAVLDDLSSGRAGRLDPQVPLHKLSITDAAALTGAVTAFRPELICHLAAQIDVRASVAAPADDAQINVLGMVNLLEAARAAGARVLFASSGGALYGRDAPIPSLEDVLPLPESPYGIAKYCAEQYIGLYNRLHGTRHSVLRLANVYGPEAGPGRRGRRHHDFLRQHPGGPGAHDLRRRHPDPRLRLCG